MVLFRGLVGLCLGVERHALAASSSWGLRGLEPRREARARPCQRRYATCPNGMKVTICGAAGCTGQPLALLLKQCALIDEIALYDQCPTCGFGVELSHVDTKPKVSSYSGRHMLAQALSGSTVVVIVARSGQDLFECNAPIITEIALQICNACPRCFTIVGTEPVESLVPLVAEIQRLRNVYDPRKLMGCVELNCVRANTVLADFLRVPPETVRIPVIGGATPQTMVPVLSAACHPGVMSQEQTECVTSCIMGGTEAICASLGCATATPCLAGAFALARVTINVVKGLQGTKNVQCGYVDSLGTCAPDIQFFASDVVLGPSGAEKNLGVPELSKFENCLLCNALPWVRNEQCRAVWLVYQMCTQCCCVSCCVHPCTCFEPPIVPCVPPVNWTCDPCPDCCRDEYLASICRDMTCRCGSTVLCWKPRQQDYDAARASDLRHQMPAKGGAAYAFAVPKSVAIQQVLREKSKNPCMSNM